MFALICLQTTCLDMSLWMVINDVPLLIKPLGFCRANENCNAWTWCESKEGCMDELLTSIPYRGCQLKWDPHEPWGVPADEMIREFRPSTFTSGYIKRELLHPLVCSSWLPTACLSR